MKILTLDDRTYKLEKIPEWVDEKLRFAVMDNSDPANPDFFYIPLIFAAGQNNFPGQTQIIASVTPTSCFGTLKKFLRGTLCKKLLKGTL